MSWIHFLLWLLGIYILYYLVMILWDVSRRKAHGVLKQNGAELTFTESAPPKMAVDYAGETNSTQASSPAGDPNLALPEVISSGGVPLKDVFNLARKEVIVYTRQVSFD